MYTNYAEEGDISATWLDKKMPCVERKAVSLLRLCRCEHARSHNISGELGI